MNVSGFGSLQSGLGRLTENRGGKAVLTARTPLLCKVTAVREGETPLQVMELRSRTTLPWARLAVTVEYEFVKMPEVGNYVLVDFNGKDSNAPIVLAVVVDSLDLPEGPFKKKGPIRTVIDGLIERIEELEDEVASLDLRVAALEAKAHEH